MLAAISADTSSPAADVAATGRAGTHSTLRTASGMTGAGVAEAAPASSARCPLACLAGLLLPLALADALEVADALGAAGGDPVAVGLQVALEVADPVALDVTVPVPVGDADDVADAEAELVGEVVAVEVAVAVAVDVDVAVAVGVAVPDAVGVAEGVTDGVGDGEWAIRGAINARMCAMRRANCTSRADTSELQPHGTPGSAAAAPLTWA